MALRIKYLPEREREVSEASRRHLRKILMLSVQRTRKVHDRKREKYVQV